VEGVRVSRARRRRWHPAPRRRQRATAVEIAGEVSCSIPFVGGKLASYVGANVERTMRAEEEFNDTYLV